jgi:hypothetical protein
MSNVVSFSSKTKERVSGQSGAATSGSGNEAVSAAIGATVGGGAAKDAGTSATITVLGDPELRVGRSVAVSDGNPTSPWKGVALRIQQVKHVYDMSKGFTTQVTVTAAKAGKPAGSFAGARGVVDQWNMQLDKSRSANPSVDMGQAASYLPGTDATATDAGHRVTLHYGPKSTDSKRGKGGAPVGVPADGAAPAADQSPSTDQEITDDDRSDLLKRPIASLFAFDNVGLVTPVYPGMRAVLVHNGQSTNDAVVAGWLWPTKPNSPVPPNRPGDYWLALPTELDNAGKPKGKGVNDLVDSAGNRVISAVSARIVIGRDALDDVGTRPQPGTANTLVIEHSSGTKLTIADNGSITIDSAGEVNVTTRSQSGLTIDSAGEVKITTQARGITLGNGAVSVKIAGNSVQVGR